MDITLTSDAQKFIDEMMQLVPGSIRAGVADPAQRNVTMTYMANNLVERFDPFIGWVNEEDPESMIEVIFQAPADAGFEDGVMLAEYAHSVFANWDDFQCLDSETARLLFDNPDELAPGDRVVVEGSRRGKVVETEREDQDEPRTLRVLVDYDDSEEVGWAYRVEVERQ
jgi:hypothetical protein